MINENKDNWGDYFKCEDCARMTKNKIRRYCNKHKHLFEEVDKND